MNDTTEQLDIETILPWTKPRRVDTRGGPRDLSTAPPDEKFWALWKNPATKQQLVLGGVSVGREWNDKSKWVVNFWRLPPKEELARLETSMAQSTAVDADIEIPHPPGLDYWGYQKAGIRYALARPSTLIADAPRLGKTVQAIGFINAKPDIKTVLVVCPAGVKIEWWRHFQSWLVRPFNVRMVEPKWWPQADIHIINYDILTRFPEQLSELFDLAIVDEIHEVRNSKTKRCQAVLGIKARYKLGLTGTPMVNRPSEIFWPLHWLDPVQFHNFWAFTRKYTGGTKGSFGYKADGVPTEVAERALQIKLRSTCFVGDTLIATENGNIEIQTIVSNRIPIRVWSRDSLGRLSLQPVVGYSAHPHQSILVKVVHQDGSFTCTPDHRIFTETGYVRADRLTPYHYLLSLRPSGRAKDGGYSTAGSMVLQSPMRNSRPCYGSSKRIPRSAARTPEDIGPGVPTMRRHIPSSQRPRLSQADLLLIPMPRQIRVQEVQHGQEAVVTGSHSKKIRRTKGSPKSRALLALAWKEGFGKREIINVYRTERSMASHGSESAEGTSSAADSIVENTLIETSRSNTHSYSQCPEYPGVARGLSDHPERSSDICGCSDPGDEIHNRDRRCQSHTTICKEVGQGARHSTALSRVLSVEVVEMGHRGRPSGSTGKSETVYDLEVLDNHNFFANGILAHNCMVRRMKEEVWPDMPPTLRTVIEIPHHDEHLKEMEREATRQIPTEKLEALKAALELSKVSDNVEDYQKAVNALKDGQSTAFELMAALRQATAMAMIPHAIAHLTRCFDEGIQKIVFFSHHREFNDTIHATFPNSVQHYGGMSPADKQAAIDRFFDDPSCNLFSGSLRASSVGIPLHCANYVVFGEHDWTPGIMSQAEDRCANKAQKNNISVDVLVLEGSLLATMAKRTVEKQNAIDKCLDKDRHLLSEEPIVVIPQYQEKAPKPISTSRKEMIERSATMDPATIAAVHECLKRLARVCDGALELDDVGFNGCDSRIGKSLAGQARLSPLQAVLGSKILRKYAKSQLAGFPHLEAALRSSKQSDETE